VSVTMSKIAEIAGVSIGTVSLALRDHPRIGENTKVRIRAIVNELNYRPNALGRALSLGRTHTIALLVNDVGNPFYGEVVHGVERTAQEKGYNVILGDSHYDPLTERLFIESLLGGKSEGLIIAPTEIGSDYKYIEDLERQDIPFVLLRKMRDIEADYVMVDDETAAYKLCKYMINLGYKTIGYVGNIYTSGTDHDRFAGYKKALEDNGIRYDKNFVKEAGFKMEDGCKAAKNLLKQPARPRAIIAFSDVLAMGVIRGAKELGLQVPEDLAVVGFDDIEFAACCEVPLTTMALPKHELGSRAVKLLFQRIEEKSEGGVKREVQHILLETKLVIRESCGARLNRAVSR